MTTRSDLGRENKAGCALALAVSVPPSAAGATAVVPSAGPSPEVCSGSDIFFNNKITKIKNKIKINQLLWPGSNLCSKKKYKFQIYNKKIYVI